MAQLDRRVSGDAFHLRPIRLPYLPCTESRSFRGDGCFVYFVCFVFSVPPHPVPPVWGVSLCVCVCVFYVAELGRRDRTIKSVVDQMID